MSQQDRNARPPQSLGEVRPERPGDARPLRRPEPGMGYPSLQLGDSDKQSFYISPGEPVRPLVQPRRRGRGRVATIIFLALVGCIAVGLGLLVAMPPVDLVRSQIASEVERQTGRKVAIRDAGVSFSSGLGVSLSDVTLSATPAAGGGPLLAAERMEVTLGLLPLVAREVKIERLTLVRPMLTLKVDATGRRNWDFARSDEMPAPGRVRYAQAAGSLTDANRLPPDLKEFARNGAAPVAPSGRRNSDLSLSDIRIVDGRVRYEDGRSGQVHDLRKIDAQVSLPSLAGALAIKGEFTLGGERLAVDARFDQFQELLSERTVGSRIKVDGAPLELSYDGRLAGLVQPVGEGRVQIKCPSAATVARLFSLPLSGLESLGAITLDGQLRATSNSLALSSANFAAGGTQASGSIGVESGAERPRIVANLRFAALDLDHFSDIGLAAVSPTAAAPPEPENSAGRFALPIARSPGGGSANSIDELLGRDKTVAPSIPGTKVHGFRMRAGNAWNVEAIDAALLRTFDADARLHFASLKSGQLQAAGVQAGVELKAGVMRVSLTDGQLAGGAVRGLASLDARQPALTIGANLSGDNVALKPVLDAIGIEPLDGRGRVIIAVSAQGGSERELISTLAGRAEIKVTNGAVLGWDADAMLDALAHGKMPPSHRQPGARTPFKELSATFQLAHGVARSRDLKIESPSLVASGTGTINIVDRNVDLQLKPRVAAGGLEVPVRVAGNWDNPSVVADVAGALKSPQAQEAARHLKDGNVEGALRSVIGNGPKADAKIEKAKEALRGLLGR